MVSLVCFDEEKHKLGRRCVKGRVAWIGRDRESKLYRMGIDFVSMRGIEGSWLYFYLHSLYSKEYVTAQRRRYRRHYVELPVSVCSAYKGDGSNNLEGITVDLSVRGVALKLRNADGIYWPMVRMRSAGSSQDILGRVVGTREDIWHVAFLKGQKVTICQQKRTWLQRLFDRLC